MADNHTSRMVALLGALRKQMNGAMLDTFRCYGADYGANYGVAIHTLRDMASEVGCDDEFARYLYRQQVRELQIIALWCADPMQVVGNQDLEFWGAGLINSELAEQAAHALLSRVPSIATCLAEWIEGGDVLRAYAALLAASRSTLIASDRVLEAVQMAVEKFPDNRLVAQGAVALAASLIARERPIARQLLCISGDSASARYLLEEVAWRLEY